MITSTIPYYDNKNYPKEVVKQLLTPDEKVYKEIQHAAAFWNSLDFNEETRFQVEKLLVQDK